VYGQIAKSPENGGSNHSDGGEIADFVESNGKLETFKDLTI
jgi:peptide alpha-N-acetyltransferase